ncbi:hypothetical protein GCM10028818_41170 [Spirosoma horti]
MPFNTEDAIAQRRANVARLYLQGLRQSDIAIREKVTQGQVSQDLVAIRAEWQESTIFDFNEAKIQELVKIDHLESTLWDAWHDSKQPLKKKSTKMRGEVNETTDKKAQKAKNLETTDYTEERLGDPRYLIGVDRCIERRCRILGLEAPLKIAQTDTDGVNIKAARTIYIVDTTDGHKVPAPDDDYSNPDAQ